MCAVPAMDSSVVAEMCPVYAELARAAYEAGDDAGCVDNGDRYLSIMKSARNIVLIDADPVDASKAEEKTKMDAESGSGTTGGTSGGGGGAFGEWKDAKSIPPNVDVPQSMAVAECCVTV